MSEQKIGKDYYDWIGTTKRVGGDELVTVFRATPKPYPARIYPGAWVTMNEDYLDEYVGKDWKTTHNWITAELPAKHLVDAQTGSVAGDTLIYVPPIKEADINLPINEGDEILTGHWKNHKEVVKEIGTDKNGQPTVNDHGILSIRIPELMNKKEASKEKPTVFLGGDVSKEDWRKPVMEHFKGQQVQLLDPTDPNWTAEENIYLELADAATADLIIFYKGGEGTQKEMGFFDELEMDYEEYDDIDALIQGIETFLADWNNKEVMTLERGETVKVEGIPMVLEEAVEVSTAEGNQEVIKDLKEGSTEAQASIRRITAAIHELGCVLIPVPMYLRSYFLTEFLSENLDPNTLASGTEDLFDSLEVDSHMTVLYGTTEDNVEKDIEVIKNLFTKAIPIKTLPTIAYFDNEDASVAYVQIESKELEDLHYTLAEKLENNDTHPEYIPHMALAYLKPGERLKSDKVKTFEWDACVCVMSQPDGHMTGVISKDEDPEGALQGIIDTLTTKGI